MGGQSGKCYEFEIGVSFFAARSSPKKQIKIIIAQRSSFFRFFVMVGLMTHSSIVEVLVIIEESIAVE